MILPWRKLSEKVEKVGWRTILHRVFEHPNGKEVECTIVDDMTGAAILPVTPEGSIVLCRHFRPGPEEVLYQLPAGMMERGEGVFDTAQRELLEETGYEGELHYAGNHHAWSWGSGTAHVFIAENCRKVSDQKLDDFEVIETKTVSLEVFEALLRGGRIVETANASMALDFLKWMRSVRDVGNEPRRVACCLLRDGERFLMQHRTDDAPRDPGKWGVFGGHIDDDETPPEAIKTPYEAIRREFMEELQYRLSHPRLLLVHRNDEVEASLFTEEYDHVQSLVQMEGQGMRWCTFEDALRLDLCDLDRAMLERLLTVWHDAEEEKI